jgi:hypothetical protein
LRDRAALGALWPTGDADAQGYEEIEARADSAYEHWVGSDGLSFRGRDDAERLGNVVKFRPQLAQRLHSVRAVSGGDVARGVPRLMPERRRHRISSKTRGGGIGAKLGVYDDVFLCLSPGEPWLEHGIVEHRYKELCPAAYLEMIRIRTWADFATDLGLSPYVWTLPATASGTSGRGAADSGTCRRAVTDSRS